MKDFRNLKVWGKPIPSASELDYHFLLARDLGFFEDADYRRLAGELSQMRKMLTSLIQKVQRERLAG